MIPAGQLPEPFRFNPWKHHLGWIRNCLQQLKKTQYDPALQQKLIATVSEINSNYVDIYTGEFSVNELVRQIDDCLKLQKIIDSNCYASWLGDATFRILTLGDGSEWVLRQGANSARYVHFHPSRNAPNMLRLHGNTWKTALAMKILNVSDSLYNIQVINWVRKEYLHLSPLKNSIVDSRLLPAFRLLEKIS